MKPIARFESINIHEIAVSMNKRADEIGDTVDSMLKAGANVVIAAQRTALYVIDMLTQAICSKYKGYAPQTQRLQQQYRHLPARQGPQRHPQC